MTHTADTAWFPPTCTTCRNQLWPCPTERQRAARVSRLRHAYRRRRK